MKPRAYGNGPGKVDVHTDDMKGWVRVHTDELAIIPDELGAYLSEALTDWFRQRPHLTLRCVYPVVRDGYTIELHAWYTQHVLPEKSGHLPPER
jgi:hypothetical protein